MRNPRLKILHVLLIILVLSIVISFGVQHVIVNVVSKDLVISDTYQNNDSIALSSANYLDSRLQEEIATIIGVEVAHYTISGDANIFSDSYYTTLLEQNESILSIEIIDTEGMILYSSRENDNRTGISISNYELFEEATENHTIYTGNFDYNADSNKLVLEMLYTGEEVFVLGSISIDFFYSFGEDFKESFPGKEILIIDERGIFLFDSVNSYHLIQYRDNELNSIIENYEDQQHVIHEYNDVESILSIQTLDTIDWKIVIYEEVDSAFYLGSLMSNYYTYSILGIVILFTLTNVIVLFSFTREFRLMQDAYYSYGVGDFEKRMVLSRFKEIHSIRSSINEMGQKIQSITGELKYLAFHDSLTGLKSKNRAIEDFDTVRSINQHIALLYLDVNRFRVINENFGYDTGDECLIQIAVVLSEVFDYVYRVEGEEFLILFPYDSVSEIDMAFEQMNYKIEKGIIVDNTRFYISFKVGVSTSEHDGEEYATLYKKAIIAMQDVSVNWEHQIQFYDSSKEEYFNRRSRVEILLKSAFDHSEFTVVFQPILDVKTKEIRGFEVLSRWYNSELGVVHPSEFIPILEQNRMITQLDEEVIYKSMMINKYLSKEFSTKYVLSINISVVTLMKDNFIDVIDNALERFDYNPSQLELEITESSIIEDFDKVTEKMRYLKAKGVKFSEDDFGDGFSSLTYLTRLNIDTLKISRNFLSNILSSVKSRMLIQTILELSKRLGFYTIVEGVEDVKTFELFKEFGCDYVQGYLFYKPLTEEQLIQLLKENTKIG